MADVHSHEPDASDSHELDASGSLSQLLAGLGLEVHLPTFEEEELTLPLLQSMGDALSDALSELGIEGSAAREIVAAVRSADDSSDGGVALEDNASDFEESGSSDDGPVLEDELQGPRTAPLANERPYPAWLVGGQLERRRWDDPDVERFLERNLPVVLTGGCPLSGSLVGRWTFAYLSEHMGDDQLMAHFAPRATTKFNRFYGKGLGKGGVRSMSFERFAAIAAANEARPSPPWRYYVQAGLVFGSAKVKSGQLGGEMRTPFGTFRTARVGAGVLDDLRRLDWDYLTRVCGVAASEGLHSCTMWAGYGGGCTPLHFDAMSNFLTQIAGRKRVLVFPPSQTFNLYPYPSSHPMDQYAQVDVEHPDTAAFPALARARGLEAVLGPGEVLWLPSFWWHHVSKMDEGEENLSLNYWVGAKADGSTLLGTRHRGWTSHNVGTEDLLEQNGAEALGGVEDVGRLLNSLASGADAEALLRATGSRTPKHAGRPVAAPPAFDLGPLESRRFQAAMKLRLDLLTQLGGPTASALLRACTRHGRLHPGLHPPVEGPTVNSEKGALTPADELERLMRSVEAAPGAGGGIDSPFL